MPRCAGRAGGGGGADPLFLSLQTLPGLAALLQRHAATLVHVMTFLPSHSPSSSPNQLPDGTRRRSPSWSAASREGLVPGAVAAVGTAEGTLHRQAFGWAALDAPSAGPWPRTTCFDLASLTKIVVTTTLALRYLEQGRLFLDQPVAVRPPRLRTSGDEARQRVTLRHLLTHTSGLPAWKDLRPDHQDGPDAARAGAPPLERRSASPSSAPRERPWSTATSASSPSAPPCSAVGGAPLDGPRPARGAGPPGHGGRHATSRRPRRAHAASPPRTSPSGAASCSGDRARRQRRRHWGASPGTPGSSPPAPTWSASAACGSAMGAWRARRVRSPGPRCAWPRATRQPALPGQPCAWPRADQPGSVSRRGLGWVLQPNPFWVPADLCSPQAYGHTGFTGTSLLLDPVAGIFAVLLTNRVHPTPRERLGGGGAGGAGPLPQRRLGRARGVARRTLAGTPALGRRPASAQAPARRRARRRSLAWSARRLRRTAAGSASVALGDALGAGDQQVGAGLQVARGGCTPRRSSPSGPALW